MELRCSLLCYNKPYFVMSVKINPQKAYLTKDTELLSKMDPFVQILLGSQKFKTKVIQEGGKNVQYDEQFIINAQGDNKVKVAVYDDDGVSKDEVGTGELDLTDYFNGKSGVKFVSLKFDGKPSGKVLFRIVQKHQNITEVEQFDLRKEKTIKFFTPNDIMRDLMGIPDVLHDNLKQSHMKNRLSASIKEFDPNIRFSKNYINSSKN